MRWFAFLVPVLFLSCDAVGHQAMAAMASTQLSASVLVVDSSSPRYGTAYASTSSKIPLSQGHNSAPTTPDDARDTDSRQSFGYSWSDEPPPK
jgi:hypothetical protein